jgi:hypothetical protein
METDLFPEEIILNMEIISYRNALTKALEQLSAHDETTCLALWNFLYDWCNRLPACEGAIQFVLSDKNLGQDSRELLEELSEKLKYLDEDMRGALVDYAQQGSKAKSE